jgi:hypothetical protein
MQYTGHEANYFGRRYLHEWEERALYKAGYMAPMDFRCPYTWRLSASGIPIPPVPHARGAQLPPQGPRQQGLVDDVLHGAPELRACALRGQRPCTGQSERRCAKTVVGRPRPHPLLGPRPHRRGQPPTADNAAAAQDVTQDGRPGVSSSRSSSSTPRTPCAGGIIIGSPPSAPSTRLLHPKKESGSSGACSARVKKEGDITPA